MHFSGLHPQAPTNLSPGTPPKGHESLVFISLKINSFFHIKYFIVMIQLLHGCRENVRLYYFAYYVNFYDFL